MDTESEESFTNEELYDHLVSEIKSELNLDNETLDECWNSYLQFDTKYSLEGKKLDWLACALYVACRNSANSNKSQNQNRMFEGNGVSLTRILRSCDISLVKFFHKIKNWSDMARLPDESKSKIEQIEKNFNVTSVIFRKYKPIFEHIFKCPIPPCRFSPKNRKIRKQPINSLDIFTFCWTLFVFVKSRFSRIGEDLVNSYHLLLVCIDYCFSSVLSFDNYRDILRTEFYEMLTKEFNHDVRSYNNDNRVSIIDVLCKKFRGIPMEIKHIRKHWFKCELKRMIDKNELRKKKTNSILDPDAIDYNYKAIKNKYEKFVLTVGDFDECIFLNETATEELGTSETHYFELDERLQKKQQEFYGNSNSNALVFATPLSSKQYLASQPSSEKLTPISSATNSISRLQSILLKHTNKPSANLELLFEKCESNPKARIEEIIQKMGDIFAKAHAKNNQNECVIRSAEEFQCVLISGDEFASRRRVLGETFFFHILEKILISEIRRFGNDGMPETQIRRWLSKMLSNDRLIRSFFACSLEIILFAYNLCNRVFPWILEIYDDDPHLKIEPFFFYKVIEPIIREEQGLSRDIVKHLKGIEETILDSLAWKSDSPLWVYLAETPPPSYVEVQLNEDTKQENGASPAIKRGTTNMNMNNISATVKRQLYPASDSNVPLQGSTENVTTDDKVIKEEIDENIQANKNKSSPPTPNKIQYSQPGVGLFFRKVYSLASLRLRDLLKHLQINSDEILKKTWTFLEHTLQTNPYLMCDHHLDQLIMCSIYIITKINIKGERSIPFQTIIEAYRIQPQASNKVYRNVLLSLVKKSTKVNGQASADITTSSANNNNNETKPTYGTIIEFYNNVFMPNAKPFVMKFSSDEPNSNVKLSPLPRNRYPSPNIHSPLRCAPNSKLFISPLKSTYTSPSKPITYRIQNNLDTSNDLENLNNMMKFGIASNRMSDIMKNNNISQFRASIVQKRLLQDDENPSKNYTGLGPKGKIQKIHIDRENCSNSNTTVGAVNDNSIADY